MGFLEIIRTTGFEFLGQITAGPVQGPDLSPAKEFPFWIKPLDEIPVDLLGKGCIDLPGLQVVLFYQFNRFREQRGAVGRALLAGGAAESECKKEYEKAEVEGSWHGLIELFLMIHFSSRTCGVLIALFG